MRGEGDGGRFKAALPNLDAGDRQVGPGERASEDDRVEGRE